MFMIFELEGKTQVSVILSLGGSDFVHFLKTEHNHKISVSLIDLEI